MPKLTLLGRPVKEKILTARMIEVALTYPNGTYGALDFVAWDVVRGVKDAIGKELYKVVISNNEP